MNITFSKYHALGNDFIVLDASRHRIARDRLPAVATAMCCRHTGVGADGIVYLAGSRKADRKFDIYNADGGWAEKSGNGLRIAGVHLVRTWRRHRNYTFETATSVDEVSLSGGRGGVFQVSAGLGQPEFVARKIPVRTRQKYVINAELDFDGFSLPVSCVAAGNPHTVIPVDNFDFDWQALGRDIEQSRVFPNGTNVEFVKPITRRKIRAKSWERGAGPTGSSGTGAAGSVCALVMLGVVERSCEVVFDAGSLHIDWHSESDIVEVAGPVAHVMDGTFTYR